MKPIANNFGPVALPPTDPRYVDGAPGWRVPSVAGLAQDMARQRLRDAGFQVADQATPVNSSRAVRHGGRHGSERPDGSWLDHHHPDLQRHPAATATAAGGDTGICLCRWARPWSRSPGLPPITVPVLGPPPPPAPPPPP